MLALFFFFVLDVSRETFVAEASVCCTSSFLPINGDKGFLVSRWALAESLLAVDFLAASFAVISCLLFFVVEGVGTADSSPDVAESFGVVITVLFRDSAVAAVGVSPGRSGNSAPSPLPNRDFRAIISVLLASTQLRPEPTATAARFQEPPPRRPQPRFPVDHIR